MTDIEYLEQHARNYNFWYLLQNGRPMSHNGLDVSLMTKTGEQDCQGDRIVRVGNRYYCLVGYGSSWDDWEYYYSIYEVRPVEKQVIQIEWEKV